jgi:large subunit ribosomal protein L30
MIAAIRITGDVNLKSDIRETLERIRLRRKYSCIVIEESEVNSGMIKKIKDFIAYGEIKKEVFEQLLEKRGQLIDKTKKLDAKKIIEGLEKGKKYQDLNLKPFFRLHPPRKGIEAKKHFGVGKGVLGNNKEKINDLILRML